jgi:hypothetical protein
MFSSMLLNVGFVLACFRNSPVRSWQLALRVAICEAFFGVKSAGSASASGRGGIATKTKRLSGLVG